MSEEQTQNLSDGRSFEERVFDRFDSLEAVVRDGHRDLDSRLQRLESESERRAVETKPIWERALAEIVELRGEMKKGFSRFERKIELLSRDIFRVREEHEDLVSRLESLESKSA